MYNKTWLLIIFKRFFKGFVSAGATSAIYFLQTMPIDDFGNPEKWVPALAIAFMSGALLALEKWSQGYNPQ